jgi:hypothetical protein
MKQTPIQIRGNGDMPGNVVAFEVPIYTVPAGKRLIIEYASMEAALPVGQTVRMEIQILTGNPPGLSWVGHMLPMSAPAMAGLFTGAHYTSVGQMVRAYADAGNVVRICGQRNDGTGGSASATFAIAGYEVNLT